MKKLSTNKFRVKIFKKLMNFASSIQNLSVKKLSGVRTQLFLILE